MPRYPELAGRVAIVTGANHGIGAATAVALAAEGIAVLVAYLALEAPPDPSLPAAYGAVRAGDADEVVARIEATGGSARAVARDLADPGAAAALFDAAEAALGPVEILVNNASGWRADTFSDAVSGRFGRALRPVTAESLDAQFAVDVRAAALLIAELARRHNARDANWGRIVGLTSGGPEGFPGEVSYGAAKAAQENYTMAAAQELARYGITANVVHPPVTDTGWITPEVAAAVEGRVATPADVAEVIVWLCSDAARLVTGNSLRLH